MDIDPPAVNGGRPMLSRPLSFGRIERRSEGRRLPDSRAIDVESPNVIAHRRHKEDIMFFPIRHLNTRYIKRLGFNSRIVIDLKGLHSSQTFARYQCWREV